MLPLTFPLSLVPTAPVYAMQIAQHASQPAARTMSISLFDEDPMPVSSSSFHGAGHFAVGAGGGDGGGDGPGGGDGGGDGFGGAGGPTPHSTSSHHGSK